jgi:glycine oxidase
MTKHRIVIVGAGIVGLTCAYELSGMDFDVTVIDPAPGMGATRAAAGMLAAVSETHFGETDHAPQLLAAAHAWPAFAADIEQISGRSVSFFQSGTLLLGITQSDRNEIDRLARLHASLGLDAREIQREELHHLEPSLSPRITRAYLVDSDHQVDGRAVVEALQTILEQRGVAFVSNSVQEIVRKGAEVHVVGDDHAVYSCDRVVVAAGAHINAIAGLTINRIPSVRAVKGEIIRLHDEERRLNRVLRAVVNGRSVYLVPRPNGELVIGATSLETPDGVTVRSGAIYELLSDARTVYPGIDELAFKEASTGLRPARDTGSPFIAFDGEEVVVVGGHYRNGILLAPLTASVVGGLLAHDSRPQAELFEVLR